MEYIKQGKDILLKTADFDLDQTLDCGQAFRWEKISDNTYHGFALNTPLTISQEKDYFRLADTTEETFLNVWVPYLDLDTDYTAIKEQLSQEETLAKACEYAGGIRLLRQDSWEALCSFIISQNNNIARIKGIIKRLCDNFGEQIPGGFSFPTAEKLAALSVDDLEPIRSGFRAKYIIDAAQKFASKQINTDILYSAPLTQAQQELMKIKGVGIKVANCVLLFAFKRIEAFPEDVWIKKAMNFLFDGQLPAEAQPYAGIVQQYIFHYSRITKLQPK